MDVDCRQNSLASCLPPRGSQDYEVSNDLDSAIPFPVDAMGLDLNLPQRQRIAHGRVVQNMPQTQQYNTVQIRMALDPSCELQSLASSAISATVAAISESPEQGIGITRGKKKKLKTEKGTARKRGMDVSTRVKPTVNSVYDGDAVVMVSTVVMEDDGGELVVLRSVMSTRRERSGIWELIEER
ncbi:hypothetical protein C1H46_007150 [Malus baccata]|uniref:Uncharacterized protein n=1 Tax=Malus baccata TaxID=106549 RepID=A0A540N9S4_MALBA|nr:hypothetical protein C1H46_007150 [Malus baccata]